MTYRLPLAVLLLCSALSAQADHRPQFEVASLKVSAADSGPGFGHSGCSGGPGSPDPELFRCENFPLRGYILRAYQADPFTLIGPNWLNDVKLDVTARVPAGATKEQFYLMLQDLLTKRLKVETHREQRTLAVYLLGVADPRKLKVWGESAPADSGGRTAADGAMVRRMAGWTMQLASMWFAGELGAPVIDQTGLAGKYDMAVTWTPAVGDERGPSLVEAVREQLGLKLEPARRPTEVLIVDHAEQVPVEN